MVKSKNPKESLIIQKIQQLSADMTMAGLNLIGDYPPITIVQDTDHGFLSISLFHRTCEEHLIETTWIDDGIFLSRFRNNRTTGDKFESNIEIKSFKISFNIETETVSTSIELPEGEKTSMHFVPSREVLAYLPIIKESLPCPWSLFNEN